MQTPKLATLEQGEHKRLSDLVDEIRSELDRLQRALVFRNDWDADKAATSIAETSARVLDLIDPRPKRQKTRTQLVRKALGFTYP